MRRPLFFVLAAIVPLLLYARTTTYGFVHADDADLIAGNQKFLGDLRNVPRAFTRSYFEVEGELTAQKTYYRPVAIVSFMLDAARAGADPRAYHLTNTVLHAVATCLLLALAVTWGAPPWSALAAALVFAVHPVNVQAVAWIAGRNDLLLAVCGLASLLAWHSLDGVSWSRGAAAAHAAAFALALFSKETGLFFPVLAVVHQRVVDGAKLTRAQWIALATDAAIVGVWAVLRADALSGQPSELSAASLRTAVVNSPQVLLHAGKMLLPVNLTVAPSVTMTGMLLGAAALLLLAWGLPRAQAIFAATWALAFLLPTLIVPGLPAYEHRAYVPLAGIAIAGALSTKRQSDKTTNRQSDKTAKRQNDKTTKRQKDKTTNWPTDTIVLRPHGRWRAGALSVCALSICALTVLAWRRQPVFQDAFAYWTDAARDRAFGPMAHVNLGQLHEAGGQLVDARREYLRALDRDPNTPKAHNDLGVVLMKLGEPDLALEHFREETRRHPWNADAWFNLGLFEEQRGNTEAARGLYQRAIEANRGYAPAYEKLGLTAPTSR